MQLVSTERTQPSAFIVAGSETLRALSHTHEIDPIYYMLLGTVQLHLSGLLASRCSLSISQQLKTRRGEQLMNQ